MFLVKINKQPFFKVSSSVEAQSIIDKLKLSDLNNNRVGEYVYGIEREICPNSLLTNSIKAIS